MKKILATMMILMFTGFVLATNGQGAMTGTGVNLEANGLGEDSNIGSQVRLNVGNYPLEQGNNLRVSQQTENRLRLRVNDSVAETELELEQKRTQRGTELKATLGNGKKANIKVMPNVASENALKQLRLRVCNSSNNCSIELKEVGKGNQTQAVYEVQAEKQARLLGLFKTKMQVKAQVDAESGEVIQTNKP